MIQFLLFLVLTPIMAFGDVVPVCTKSKCEHFVKGSSQYIHDYLFA